MNKRGLNAEKLVVAWLNDEGRDNAARERVSQLFRDVRTLAGAEQMRFQVPSSEGYELLRQMDDKTPMYVAMQELRRLGTGLKDENGPRQFDFSAAARLDSVLAKFQFRPYCNLVRSNPSDSQRGVGRRRTAPTKGRLILHMVPSGWNPSELTVREALKDVWPTKKVINDAPSEVQDCLLYTSRCV